MKINYVKLGDRQLTEEEAKSYVSKYVQDYMSMECLFGGVGIQTPEGLLIADVSLE